MNNSSIQIREGRLEDVAIITEYNRRMALETEGKKLDTQTVAKGVEQGLLQPEKCRFFVAETQGSVVGQAMVTYEWSDWDNRDLWWIQSVYVHQDHRRQSVFTKLYRHIESLAREKDQVRALRLYVKEDNAVGQAVYKKLNMAYTGYHVYEREF
jgi:ribosomal protein S18 acetylase RimI-like enzyme